MFKLFVLSALISTNLMAESWRVFFYMDATDNLTDMAFKNLTDMMRGKPNKDVQFLVQLRAYGKSGLRYQITENGLEFCEETHLTGDPQIDLQNGLSWGFAECHNQRTMLILSDHGWGILDPEWNAAIQEWQAGEASISNSCPLKQGLDNKNMVNTKELHQKKHKGYMFGVDPRVYLNNNAMLSVFDNAQQNILNGQKLDVIAFDTCMGAMLEIAYQLAPYAKYLLGVQSCALLDGFDYQSYVSALNNTGNSTKQALREIVDGFDKYYQQHDLAGIYTYTALELERTAIVRQKLDTAIKQISVNYQYVAPLQIARNQAHRFCMWPMYADPINFLQQFEAACVNLQIPIDTELKIALDNFYASVSKMVVARCGGFTTTDKAFGCAIYLPAGSEIYPSYLQTQFARDGKWLELLNLICG